MIKIVFFDVDGTLLSSRGEVLESTKRALKQLKEKGILTCIATGRHQTEIVPFTDLGFEGFITLNGGYCYNRKELIGHTPIFQEDVRYVLEEIHRDPFPCAFVEDDRIYINYHSKEVETIHKEAGRPWYPLGDLNRGYDHPIYQITPYCLTAERESALARFMPHSHGVHWHTSAMDILPQNSGKEKGVEDVLKYYHISRREAMAFGDGGNDRGMLEAVEYGIAMGNAEKELQDKAAYITQDHNHDGIYFALKHYGVL